MIDDIRDIFLIVYLGAGIVLTLVLIFAALFIARAVLKIIKLARQSVENVGKVTDATVEHLVKPLQEGMSFGNVLGGGFGFVTGFVSGLRRRSERKRQDKGD